MGVREALNQHQAITVAAGIMLIGAAALAIMKTSASDIPGPLKRMYYTDDDGKTYFADDATKICPFDHNGKPAVRAFVYQCGKDAPSVLYLQRYTDDAKSKILSLTPRAGDSKVAAEIAELDRSGVEVKKPGESKWTSPNSEAGMQMVVPASINGAVPPAVYP